jgi:sugar-specific transcriptional regulator TrmB
MGAFLEKHPDLVGMGEDEQKVYSLLGRGGEYTAREISGSLSIPLARTLEALFNLQEKGITVSRGEVPRIYALRFKDPALNQEPGNMYYI